MIERINKVPTEMIEGIDTEITKLGTEDRFSNLNEQIDEFAKDYINTQIALNNISGTQNQNAQQNTELFINENMTDSYTSDFMDDNDWNNNWKLITEKDNPLDFQEGFIRQRKQFYMMEIMDEYSLDGIGQNFKSSMKYDVTNQCYWLLSNYQANEASPGVNTIGEITKLSINMKDGKVTVLGRWYLPAVSTTCWYGICTDGATLYVNTFGRLTSEAAVIYAYPINTDGSLGRPPYQKYSGETLSLTAGQGIYWPDGNTSGFANSQATYYWTDIDIYDGTTIAILCWISGTNIRLMLINKTNRSIGTDITGVHNFSSGTNASARGLCVDRTNGIIWMSSTGTGDIPTINKFTIASDKPSNAVIKSSGRFGTTRSTQPLYAGYGITLDPEGNFCEVNNVANGTKSIVKRALTGAYWAENQVTLETPVIASVIGPLISFVDPYGNYWTGDDGAGVTSTIYRYNTTTGVTQTLGITGITGGSSTGLEAMCYDGTPAGAGYVYIATYGSPNIYRIFKVLLATLIAALGGATVTIGTTPGWTYLTNPSAGNTDIIQGLAYDTDDGVLVLTNATNAGGRRLDTLTTNGTTWTKGVYLCPLPTSSLRGLTYKNGKFYVGDYTGATSPNRVWVIDKSRTGRSSTFRVHIHQDASRTFLAAGRFGISFDGNDLVGIQQTASAARFTRFKTLEDPNAIQLHTFLDSNNILLSDNVTCVTPIAQRYFAPEDFSDIRNVPDRNYCAIGYKDAGMTVLHLDEFLNGKSSSGLERRNITDIKVQHYKTGYSELIAGYGGGVSTTNLYTSPDGGGTWASRNTGTQSWVSFATSQEGKRIFAATYGGNLYTSSDGGFTWVSRDAARQWAYICCSYTGAIAYACVYSNTTTGYIYASYDFGANWVPVKSDTNRWWYGIACSRDGKYVVACESVATGSIWVSSDYGVTWTAATGTGSKNWANVACSADGTRMAAANSAALIWTSSDYGVTWASQAGSGSRGWFDICCSADGKRLAATVTGGQIYVSVNYGVTWNAYGPSKSWNTIACTSDGLTMIASNGTALESNYISKDGGLTWNTTGPAVASGYIWRAASVSGVFNSNNNIIQHGTGVNRQIDYITIEKDMMIVSTSEAANTFAEVLVIDSKSGRSKMIWCNFTFWPWLAGTEYSGSLTERNDGITYSAGTYNSNLLLSLNENYRVVKLHARTFTKDDPSEYKGTYPVTYVALGMIDATFPSANTGGCDLLRIDWDSNNNRTPVRVYKDMFPSIAESYAAVWIAPSGTLFGGRTAVSGTIHYLSKPIWDITEDSPTSFLITGPASLGYNFDISPNSRCWRLPDGTWRHQLFVSHAEIAGPGAHGNTLIDIENGTIFERIYYNSPGSGTFYFYSIDNYSDMIFTGQGTGSDNKMMIHVKRRFPSKLGNTFNGYTCPLYDHMGLSEIGLGNRPVFIANITSTGINNLRYSRNYNIIMYAMNGGGAQMIHWRPMQNNCYHKSIELDIEDPMKYYYKQTKITPEG